MPGSWDKTILPLSQDEMMKREKSSVVYVNAYLPMVCNLNKINGYIYIYYIHNIYFFYYASVQTIKVNSQVKRCRQTYEKINNKFSQKRIFVSFFSFSLSLSVFPSRLASISRNERETRSIHQLNAAASKLKRETRPISRIVLACSLPIPCVRLRR